MSDRDGIARVRRRKVPKSTATTAHARRRGAKNNLVLFGLSDVGRVEG
jgi:hypothetical protein